MNPNNRAIFLSHMLLVALAIHHGTMTEDEAMERLEAAQRQMTHQYRYPGGWQYNPRNYTYGRR